MGGGNLDLTSQIDQGYFDENFVIFVGPGSFEFILSRLNRIIALEINIINLRL